MPFVTVDHLAGISPADRRELQRRITEVVVESLGAPPSNVRVFTRGFDPDDVYVVSGEMASGLPMIRVEFLPRSEEQKRDLVHRLAHVTAEVLKLPVEQVRTILYERSPHEISRGDTLIADGSRK